MKNNYTYSEIKEDALDVYKSLLINSKYSLQDTFYSWINDFHLDEKSDDVELNILIHVSFAYLLLIEGQDFSFLLEHLNQVLYQTESHEKVKQYLSGTDYLLFSKDRKKLMAKLVCVPHFK